MYYYTPFVGTTYPYYPYPVAPQVPFPTYQEASVYPFVTRQQNIEGQATWTEGGRVTQCNIPWSTNEYMTAAVGDNAPYQCGQNLKVRNLSMPGREIIITVVDKVPGYPANRINLHRRAFIALGADPNIGVMDVEITPHLELEKEKWGKYLLEIVQSAYPNYSVTDYNAIDKTSISADQTKETFDYILQSQQETIKVRGNVIYNPNTDRVISFDLKEMTE
ncbi:DUF3889 domain-containing protein [Oceanobacillus halotolerans]|uniref:DUF3889 domain-containing protein n=1 Tax=Oceanobacillus halotolerans TaxID=2663380 RepID=UPI0013D8E4BE|nr:DUF3889 domain-containing protein [Oceanobacillus halotolerans]